MPQVNELCRLYNMIVEDIYIIDTSEYTITTTPYEFADRNDYTIYIRPFTTTDNTTDQYTWYRPMSSGGGGSGEIEIRWDSASTANTTYRATGYGGGS